MKKILFVLLFFNSILLKAQTVLYVDSSVTASGTGASWASAYKTLNEALNVANTASTTVQYVINVAKGTYFPPGQSTATNRDSTFIISRGGIKLYGGYPNGGGARDFNLNPTILSGNIGDTNDSTDNSYHVMIIGNIAAASDSVVVDGFKIIMGTANGSGQKMINTLSYERNQGGGIYCNALGNKVRIVSCSFANNKSGMDGGAMFIQAAAPFISFCIFSDNRSMSSGGAVGNSNASSPTFFSVVFANNTAAANGGAVYAVNSMLQISLPTFTQCTLTNNTANYNGGAIYLGGNSNADCEINGSSFTNNTASSGGAIFSNIYLTSNTSLKLNNSSFSHNKALGTGGGGAVYASSNNDNLYVSGCTFSGNTALNGRGGGVWVGTTASTSEIKNSTFTADTALKGGAIYCFDISLTNCSILSNYANEGGGVFQTVYLQQVNNCIFSGNTATNQGGGYYAANASYKMKNSLFSGNIAGQKGGALYSKNVPNSAEIINTTFSGDSALSGNAIYDSLSSPTIKNCIIWDGAAGSLFNFSNSNPAITYSIVQGGYSGTGNSANDPLFVNPFAAASAPTTAGNYALTGCSPAINSGINTGVYTSVLDLAGNSRLFGPTVDIGAYEYQTAITVAGPITGSSNLCSNATLQLSNVAAGGSWSSSDTSVATINGSGLVTGVSAGTTTISYTIVSGQGCSSTATKLLTVNPAPVVAPITGPTNVCTNKSIQLSCATPGGVFSSTVSSSIATVNNSGKVNGWGSGTFNVHYTVTAGGCTTVVSTTITASAPPNVPAISGNSTVCTGSTTQLGNSMAGGIWSVSNNGHATVNGSGLVTGVSAGTDTVTYMVTPGSGCPGYVTRVITVNPSPSAPAINGNDTICSGTTITLFGIPGAGAWSSTNTNVATVTSGGLLTGVSAGTGTIKYTVYSSNGCSNSNTKTVTVIQSPAISNITGTSQICAGSTVQLSNATPGGVWSSSDAAIATVSGTGTVTGISAGTANIQYTITGSNGCPASAAFPVTINTVNVTVNEAGPILTAAQAGASYQWMNCTTGNVIPGQTGQTFIPSANGLYAAIINKNGCIDTSACINVTTVGIDTWPDDSAVKIYPNPFSGEITAETPLIIPDHISVFDVSGKMVRHMQPDKNRTVVDLSAMPDGLYYLCIEKGQARYTRSVYLRR